MLQSKKLFLIVALAVVACFVIAPLAFSQDRQVQFRSAADSRNDDDWTDARDHERCQPFCRDADCPKMRRTDDDDDHDENGHARCQPLCHESTHCAEVAVSPQYTAVASGGAAQFTALTKDRTGVRWSATVGTIDADGNYIAPFGPQSTTATVTATSKSDPAKSATATVHVVAPGQVSPTANVQVALYSISPGAPANVSVRFGKDTNYVLKTWEQPVPDGGGPVNLLVAGMAADTTYHMRAIVKFSDGARFLDYDNTFVTGSLPLAQLPTIEVTTTPGMRPQEGIELLDLVIPQPQQAPLIMATDLEGNVIWTYNDGNLGGTPQPVKLLPNGHFLIEYVAPVGVAGSVIQEVDLAGTVIWQMTLADLDAALAAATCAGCNVSVFYTHHDFAPLPNGHLVVIASTSRNISGTLIIGDVLIDLDPNHKPVWIWNEFDHLDTNRRPFGFTLDNPDWTHTNAILYSPDDSNLIVSLRHQNWLLKIDYRNGNGNGDILWKLGYQGDFALIGGTDPTDWFYAQHGPSFVSKNTTGIFSLALFDNGDDRVFPPNVTCGAMGEPACLYSTAQILQIDETSMTATLVSHPRAPEYSSFGGNAEVLKNGNLEFCESAGAGEGNIYEVLPGAGAQTVWHMSTPNQLVYRGKRIPSLYPDVQW